MERFKQCFHSIKFLIFLCSADIYFMGLHVRKPVFRVSDEVRFQPACSATETSYKIEISLIASLDMILSDKCITKVLIRLRGYVGWSVPVLFANPLKIGFLLSWPKYLQSFPDRKILRTICMPFNSLE